MNKEPSAEFTEGHPSKNYRLSVARRSWWGSSPHFRPV